MNQPASFDDVPLRPVAPGYAAPETSGLAITSLVLGCVSFMCAFILGPLAILFGIFALRGIKRSGGRLKGEGLAIGGIATGAVMTFLLTPMLLLPAIQAAREAARRNVSMNNLKQIAIALQNHHDLKGSLPEAGGGEAQESQLSWRVHLLPYLEEQGLYEQFHLDEPWDSDHNRALIGKMPAAFKDPNDRLPPGETSYLAVTGPGTAFGEGESGVTFQDYTDGSSKTIMVVEADPDQSVVWTKPDDWQYDPNDPRRGLGSGRPGGFLALFGDAHTAFIQNDADPETVKAMMTRDGGEPVEFR
jgi:hypothetical protein